MKTTWQNIDRVINKTAIITQDLLFSRFCYHCKKPRYHLFELCMACIKTIPFITTHCITCGLPLTIDNLSCGQCMKQPTPINKTIPCMHFKDLGKELVLQLKYFNGLYLVTALSRMMHHTIRRHYAHNDLPQGMVAVPMHSHKLRWRGYNQSLLLCKRLQKLLVIPNYSHHIYKQRSTSDQSSLSLINRKSNIRNAFAIRNKQKLPPHVAIIDDVMTSGNTVFELAKLLKKQGCTKVDVWCLARACPKLPF